MASSTTPAHLRRAGEEIIVNEWEPTHYFIGNSSQSDYLKKSPSEFKMIAPSTSNSYSGGNYHYVEVDFGSSAASSSRFP